MAVVRAVGHVWTATEQGSEPGSTVTYYIDQVWPVAFMGCTTHVGGGHHFCSECAVMRALQAHLARVGGLAVFVVVFCVVRRRAAGGAGPGPCDIERVERAFKLVGCSEAEEAGLLEGMGAEFGRLCDFQLQELIVRSGISRLAGAPAAPSAVLAMGAVPLQAPPLGPLPSDVLRPGLGAWLQGDARPRIGEHMTGCEPTLDNFNCTEGSAAELARGALTVVLPSIVQIVFACDGCERAVPLMVPDITRRGPQVYVRWAPLDMTCDMRALARADASQEPAPQCRVQVVNARRNYAFSAHSDMRTSAAALETLHPPPTRTPPAPPPGWPCFLRRCVFLPACAGARARPCPNQRAPDTVLPRDRYVLQDRPKTSEQDRARMTPTDWNLQWHASLAPPHQLYGISSMLSGPALLSFLAISKQQGLARAQACAMRSAAEDLQDQLFALFLGFAPGLQALHDAVADLLWEAGWVSCGEHAAERVAALQACLARVQTQAAALGASAPPGGNLLALGDFAESVRGSLCAEVLCDCAVSMFCGGPLVTDLLGPDACDALDVGRAPLEVLNRELHARHKHPGPGFAQQHTHLRAALAADVRLNLYAHVRAAWPPIAWLRRAVLLPLAGPGATPAALLRLRAFVRASAEHCAPEGGPLLLAPAAIAARARYARTAGVFLQGVAADADAAGLA